MITLDTSGLFAALNSDERDHERVMMAVRQERGSLIVPAAILGELGYLIEARLSPVVLEAFLEDLETGHLTVDCNAGDFPRISALVRRYRDLPLGLVDATVIACAERYGGRVLTLDFRHFGVVAKDARLELLP